MGESSGFSSSRGKSSIRCPHPFRRSIKSTPMFSKPTSYKSCSRLNVSCNSDDVVGMLNLRFRKPEARALPRGASRLRILSVGKAVDLRSNISSVVGSGMALLAGSEPVFMTYGSDRGFPGGKAIDINSMHSGRGFWNS